MIQAAWNPFKKFFEEEEVVDDAGMGDAHSILAVAREPYFTRIIEYLERGADAKIDTSSAVAMATSSERINTFKDIKAHLKKQIREATVLIEREQDNG